MPRNKKSEPLPARPPVAPSLDQMDFDSLEEKIRGEESLIDAETRRHREAKDVKKKIDQYELDRRLAELKKKIKK